MKTRLVVGIISLTVLAGSIVSTFAQAKKPTPAETSADKPNVLVIFGDDIGQANIRGPLEPTIH